ncbi:MAG: GIY-YIG nuclease family protein [Gammaproteobacteria bacterium]|nr:GIY-YIG nuclease family protein [Gammaproteobacteria bacterium]
MNWKIYIIRCDDDTLYTGITTDVEKRFAQHASKKGARYFFGRQPLEVMYVESGHNRSTASKREYEIKALSRKEKEALIRQAKYSA